MFPVLLKIGPVTLYSYGLMIATAFLVGALLISKRAEIEGEDPQKALDLAFYCIVAALIGSRLLYVIVEWESYISRPLNVFKVWEGGLVFYGGFIGAALTGFWFVRKEKLHPWKMADLAAPSIALGHSIGRLGCLFAGCCYGGPTDSWIGITFTDPMAIAPKGIALYPTQLFESFVEFSIFLVLIAVRPHKKFHGQLFLMWMFLYALGRFIVEFFRGDDRGAFMFGFSPSQSIAIAVFLLAGILLTKLLSSNRNSKKL
ncbi:MAG: prolipoprotein diacylglyceryl transferase [Nitrospinota bacterium]|nr:prolipoprotein diacylglyceryl transferase [Nitrospinota bacterium]